MARRRYQAFRRRGDEPQQVSLLRVTRILAAQLLLVATCGVLSQGADLPADTSTLFSGSGNCATCHVSDGIALVDSEGTDLSLSTDWRSTMMASAAKDPLWQATVEGEVVRAPELQALIEDKCTTCHMPMGRTQAHWDGAESYSLDEGRSSALALDGVSCTLCHQIEPANLGTPESFGGGYEIYDVRLIFGPYADMFTGPMMMAVNYLPVFGQRMNDSELCATCHTLFTPAFDDSGNIVGSFPEQTPYLEWENSVFPEKGTQCQTCHMPPVNDPVIISIFPRMLPAHAPFFRHVMAGGNSFMLEMLKEHAAELGIPATGGQFDMKLGQTTEQLEERAAELSARAAVSGGEVTVDVTVESLTGHKFPTGFPSRRAWIHLLVQDDDGETVFESGGVDAGGRIAPRQPGVEPHHDVIESEDQVQIYESVMEDSNGEATWTLLRAVRYRKDNRLPPKGFVSDVQGYADIAILGAAATDDDYNRDGDVEGTGRDTVTYRIDASGHSGRLEIRVELLYQAVQPRFVEHVLSRPTPATERFAGYYESAGKSPVKIQEAVVEVELSTPPEPVAFIRGDPNADGSIDLSDAVYVLLHLFQGVEDPPCRKSGDVNDDQILDISDSVFLLNFLFRGGEGIPAPYPECGPDPTADDLTCVLYTACE